MKSDEFSGKMLDDHIEVFCYCNFDYYRNLFWCFCISIYEKEKGRKSFFCLSAWRSSIIPHPGTVVKTF